MKIVTTFIIFIIALNFVGCGTASKIRVGMTMNKAQEIMNNNGCKEFDLTDTTWGKSAWKVYTMPNNTCVELFSEEAKDLIITSIVIGEIGKGYWINTRNPKNTTTDMVDISDYENEN